MTREEAIAILNHNVSACLHGTEWGEALDMAIKALEQQYRIVQILDDYDLEAWEILEKIKEVVTK